MESSSLAVALSPLLSQLAMSPAASRTALVGRAWAEPPSYKPRMSRTSSAAPRTVAATRGTDQSLRCLMRTAGAHRVSFPILTPPKYSTRGAELERCSEALTPWTYYNFPSMGHKASEHKSYIAAYLNLLAGRTF